MKPVNTKKRNHAQKNTVEPGSKPINSKKLKL
jgi:hypothetical protein